MPWGLYDVSIRVSELTSLADLPHRPGSFESRSPKGPRMDNGALPPRERVWVLKRNVCLSQSQGKARIAGVIIHWVSVQGDGDGGEKCAQVYVQFECVQLRKDASKREMADHNQSLKRN
jgi:hypothetical protein